MIFWYHNLKLGISTSDGANFLLFCFSFILFLLETREIYCPDIKNQSHL